MAVGVDVVAALELGYTHAPAAIKAYIGNESIDLALGSADNWIGANLSFLGNPLGFYNNEQQLHFEIEQLQNFGGDLPNVDEIHQANLHNPNLVQNLLHNDEDGLHLENLFGNNE